MIFSIVITGSPHSSEAPRSAYRFARAALESGHHVHRVFLHGDGVLTATALASPPQDENDIHQLWHELGRLYELDIVVCITSALGRGILDASESARYNKSHFNILSSMQLGGLGQLIDTINHSDRVITFGA